MTQKLSIINGLLESSTLFTQHVGKDPTTTSYSVIQSNSLQKEKTAVADLK